MLGQVDHGIAPIEPDEAPAKRPRRRAIGIDLARPPLVACTRRGIGRCRRRGRPSCRRRALRRGGVEGTTRRNADTDPHNTLVSVKRFMDAVTRSSDARRFRTSDLTRHGAGDTRDGDKSPVGRPRSCVRLRAGAPGAPIDAVA
jgi:hypothetical protein